MNIKGVFIISTVLVLLLLLIACTAPPLEEKVTLKQVESSQVVLPDVGQAVGPLEVQGNTQGSFLAQIMNQMVTKLKGNASSE